MSIQTVLGFDFGEQRIGIASGQSITQSSAPITTLKSINNKPDWESISTLIEQWKPDALIVGLPYYLDGNESEMTKRAEKFSRQLEGRYHLPVFTHNEALSSFEAESYLQDKKKQHDKQDIDKIAAAIIVQSWLEHNT